MFPISDQSTNELIGFIRARRLRGPSTSASVYPTGLRETVESLQSSDDWATVVAAVQAPTVNSADELRT